MNLIEQLGGYEKAKEYLRNLELIPTHEQTEDTITYLPNKLLQYRRENNIFERDDCVVIGSNHKALWFFNESYGDFVKSQFRHATDAEIKAGHRLELEILNDHDIPHNTTILER